MAEHEDNGKGGCTCGEIPRTQHTPRMAALILSTHIETANDEDPAEDDRG